MAPRTASPPRHRPRPLLITEDQELLDEVLNVAMHVGIEVDVAAVPATTRRQYPAAPLVMIGKDCADACLRAGLPRRPTVVVVGRDDGSQLPWSFAERVGAEHVVTLPTGASWLADRLAASADAPAGDGRVVAALGGRGGAGATVLAAGLAVTADRGGLRTLLIDADPLGGGVDLVLGWESLTGLRWPGLSQTGAVVHPPALLDALPSRNDLAVLSCDRHELFGLPVESMAAALAAGRHSRDLVVVDLPRRLDEAAVLALAAADRVLLVVPAELRACAAASRVAAMAGEHTDAIEIVVRGPAPGRLRTREIAQALKLPIAGVLRAEPEMARRLERGAAPGGSGKGPLAALCRRLIDDLGLEQRAVAA